MKAVGLVDLSRGHVSEEIGGFFEERFLTLREVAALSQMTARAVQASKELLARLPSWRLLFEGRCLVVTNTLGGGVLMAVGDSLQQTREMHVEEGRVRDWKRTGERGDEHCHQ